MRKVIERHPNYAVTDTGGVYRIFCPGCYSSLIPDLSNGYARVELDGKKEYIARLVLETFKPTDDETLRVFYIDGDRMNCNLSNLAWLTQSEIKRYSQYTVEYRKQLLGERA